MARPALVFGSGVFRTHACCCAALLSTSMHCSGRTLGCADDSSLIVYVDSSAPPPGNGQNWDTAFADLQDAIAFVVSATEFSTPPLIELRIAQGTYRPDRGTGDRWQRFMFRTGSSSAGAYLIRGGFAGRRAASADLRDFGSTPTILSGDLRGNDESGFANRDDNSYLVASCNLTARFLFVEGIRFRGGSVGLREFDVPIRGGGFNPAVDRPPEADWTGIDIVNCAFEENQSDLSGGAGLNAFGGAVRIWNCQFRNNRALRAPGGGALVAGAVSTQPGIADCAFESNSATHGGALYVSSQNLDVSRCVFVGNHASVQGGAVIGAKMIEGSLFLRNNAVSSGGAVGKTGYSTTLIWSSTFSQNSAGVGSSINSYSSGLIIKNCIFDGDSTSGPLDVAVRVVDSILPSEISSNLVSGFSSTIQIVGGAATFQGNRISTSVQFIRPAAASEAASAWPTWNYRLRPESLAAGIGGAPVPNDLDGRFREQDDPRPADAGCYHSTYFTCPANLTRGWDQVVDDQDFVEFVAAYQTVMSPPANPDADLNRDGVVNDTDFSLFALLYDGVFCP